MQAIIGVDIGTTNTKALVFTKQGMAIATANAHYPHISPKPGQDEIDPQLILDAVVSVIKEVFGKVGSEVDIVGIGFSSAMHSLMAVDQEAKPLTNLITWADRRAAQKADEIKNTKIGNQIYEQTGTPIHAMSPLCKIGWMKEQQPDVFLKADKFIGIKEYIWFQFFGKYQIDYSIASATGLFNIYGFHWHDESLKLAGIDAEKLSVPVPPTHSETRLSKNYKGLLQLQQDVPFIIGGSDGCLANLGSNAIQEGVASLTIGTSGAIRMATSKPRHDPQQRVFNYILTKDIYISGGATNNGGAVLQWYIKNFMNPGMDNEKDFSNAIESINQVPAGSDGLIFLPYLFGERAPIWDANAKAVFFGINPQHSQTHFLRALIEGISLALYQIAISLEETNGKIKTVYASGGFIRSNAWLQILADVFNKEIIVSEIADASAIGAAIMGFYALGLIERIDFFKPDIQNAQKYFPDLDRHQVYMKSLDQFSRLYNKLKDEF